MIPGGKGGLYAKYGSLKLGGSPSGEAPARPGCLGQYSGYSMYIQSACTSSYVHS